MDFQNYGQERERIATESEIRIFEIIKELSGREDLRLVRKSDNYVTAAIGMTDVVRFKYTPKAKWLLFPYVYDDKIRVESPEDVYDMPDTIDKAVRMADEINSSGN